jgi:hypothetical protein
MEDFEKELQVVQEELKTLKEIITSQINTISTLSETILELKKIWLLILASRMQ